MKKSLAFLLTAAIGASLLTACGQSGTASATAAGTTAAASSEEAKASAEETAETSPKLPLTAATMRLHHRHRPVCRARLP